MPGHHLFKPRLTTTFPVSSQPATAFPVSRPARAFPTSVRTASARPDRYVSSTHYGRYVLWQGRRNTELVISSHGSHVVEDRRRRHIVPPGMALHFYGPDYAAIKTCLVDQAFIREQVAARPYEIRSSGHSYLDYELSKIQSRPAEGKGENYNHVIECLPRYDLVTIEQLDDNGPHEHMLLSELLAHLRSQGHGYTKVHCFFCRSLRDRDLRRYPALQQFVRPPYMVR
ncbi:hypothetical protein CAL12_15435 [Bordetella genomosp. 8]|uniref:Putative adhesin Stv domain-containing protein n=1 Tax=Bordetella genomosp. 8 TaxID=1416806 RepID=A0A1W6YMA6_9BORD|nr:hypothetical protein CAL12_15435 [Bordetella genomosp. 8]